jgi:hypothetical protein
MKARFRKEIPGAECLFMPDDLSDYADDEWDIRISLGQAPLEEAFYYTVRDPSLGRLPIGQLLEEYALNADRVGELDVADNPELPFLQEELIQYIENARRGTLDLQFYINHNRTPGPVGLDTVADTVMGVCRYDDGSHDYRVLDLVIVPGVPRYDAEELAQWYRTYGPLWALALLDRLAERPADMSQFLKKAHVSAWVRRETTARDGIPAALNRLLEQGLIRRGIDAAGKPTLEVTDPGRTEAENLADDAAELIEEYAPYESISAHPPALGIPDGFDARTQMMEFNGVDPERAVFIILLHEEGDVYLDPNRFVELYGGSQLPDAVRLNLAYKTNFSTEVLEALKTLA